MCLSTSLNIKALTLSRKSFSEGTKQSLKILLKEVYSYIRRSEIKSATNGTWELEKRKMSRPDDGALLVSISCSRAASLWDCTTSHFLRGFLSYWLRVNAWPNNFRMLKVWSKVQISGMFVKKTLFRRQWKCRYRHSCVSVQVSSTGYTIKS